MERVDDAYVNVFLTFQVGKHGELWHRIDALCFGLEATIADVYSVVSGGACGHWLWPHHITSCMTQNTNVVFTFFSGGRAANCLLDPWSCIREISHPANQGLEANVIVRLLDASAETSRSAWDGGCVDRYHPESESCSDQAPPLRNFGCDDHVTHIQANGRGTSMPLQSPNAVVDQPHLDVHDEFFDTMTSNSAESLMPLQARQNISHLSSGPKTHVLFTTILRSRDPGVIRFLIRSGTDVNLRDNKGNGAMHMWARATGAGESLAVIGQLLINANADVNAQRYADGMTPLHHAAAGYNRRHSKLDLHKAVFLLRNGSNPWLQNAFGATPSELVTKPQLKNKFLHCLAMCPAGRAHCEWCHG